MPTGYTADVGDGKLKDFREFALRCARDEWHLNQIELAARDVEYHKKEHANEVKRAAERTAWVVALKNSLN